MTLIRTLLAATALATCFAAAAQEADIRKVLAERIPQMDKIDEVRPTPMKGLYEVRIGTDLFYTDAKGDYVIQGELIDTKVRRNLTEDRIAKLTAINFSALPFKDAVTIVRGDGEEQKIVRHNLAWGSSLESGTYFISYARDLSVTEEMLRNMFIGKPEGNTDRILDFSTAVTGGLFFSPTVEFFDDLPPAPAIRNADTEGTSPSPAADGSLGIGSLRRSSNR